MSTKNTPTADVEVIMRSYLAESGQTLETARPAILLKMFTDGVIHDEHVFGRMSTTVCEASEAFADMPRILKDVFDKQKAAGSSFPWDEVAGIMSAFADEFRGVADLLRSYGALKSRYLEEVCKAS